MQIKYIDKNFNQIIENLNMITSNTNEINSKNAPSKVIFNNKSGFYKKSSNTTVALDKFEYIINILGNKLGVNMANTYLIYDNDRFEGIISENVCKENERLIERGSNEFSEILNSHLGTNEEYIEIINVYRYLFETYNDTVINNQEDIEKAIEVFPKIMQLLSCSEQEINNYYKMLFFDIITGNLDRNNRNFGLIIGKEIRFSPLFDNSTISIPNASYNNRIVHGFNIDQLDIYNYLMTNHFDAIEEIFNNCKDIENINNLITYCSKDLLSEKEYNWLTQRIMPHIKYIAQDSKENHQSHLK